MTALMTSPAQMKSMLMAPVVTIRPMQKMPSRYRISLHIDDEAVICSAAGQYGFRAYQLTGDDDDWGKKIIEAADHIRKLRNFA